MSVDPLVVATIALMALATYATRAGGLWLASRIEPGGRVGSFLEAIPGAILVSLVAPVVVLGGPALWVAAAAVLIVARRSGSLLAAMVVGVAVVLALRSAGVG
ncbi:putative membrane protein [Rubrobacter radiotolerans]|uniref:AzlD domain-containing protein n=1 Tax=Rubrobacter radiotolerans TaxID=42256 RepID=A0A023X1M9_RUBRA|nr:AzlD domain-containing protein [Rubrobacter radiotolerans]AHY46076.1 putative membrane protein [Rubrobacter radiotolerans]MDX5893486.1 AzlD domain-containing protein [Rubrobacter radiotolerans]SMC03829.1 Uncharacterized membrane protein [Rubrobacter radiotolerans DSM 5868]